jgi:enoyl-[acyl-carrier protein] reductase III
VSKQLPFQDLWAVILGGSSGFGLAAVEKLAASGMNIAVLFREPSATARKAVETFTRIAAEHGVSILPFNLNVLDTASRQAFITDFTTFDKAGKVKLLLHSVARGNLKPLVADLDTDGEQSLLSVEDIQMTTYAMSNSLLDWTRDILTANLFHTDTRIIGLTSEGANKHWDAYAAVVLPKHRCKA